jgi:hypothetical protein
MSNSDKLYIEDYSDHSIAVFGKNVEAYRSVFETIGGKYNPSLRGLVEGTKRIGYIFTKKRKDEVNKLVNDANSKDPLPVPAKEPYKRKEAKSADTSHDDKSLLLSKFEVLEARVAFLESKLESLNILNISRPQSASSSKPVAKSSINFLEEEEDEEEEVREKPKGRFLRK